MNPFISTQTSKDSLSEQNKASIESTLKNILVQEQHCLDLIIQLLKTENQAIVDRDIKSMGHLLDKKLPLLSKLGQLDKQRQQFFEQQTGHAYHPNAFSRFIEQYPSEDIQIIWHTIKEKLPECKTQNELNGRIINIKKNNTEKILQILLGRPANSTPTYSHLGQTNMQKRSALYTAV
ncbi:MAG: flagellar protein FlgN [gamma proteobacterium symbiont of Bathyaustriella thionipta]|nr:flagellar protein FlgN [gamma proteobacterium symbiont of Bathyaustriella thionipta]MCU7951035.1 flagellar protein FlgN [gamma proteobacterium symbiont of Bathyaustriella thionipta]MCU7951894.1 flagellar protein FlgN [gamma proteobacterium symbiont of Bathyaustriella thionipta]MCU7957544.1 flagellar protein FlgN [gamma proteobacterium symbiont of Bathyaustriella thionipta]MCU7965957.1 flagellar protein FlgN [gamma proteobacterium symbiont of Bathyaustriella thionipta]